VDTISNNLVNLFFSLIQRSRVWNNGLMQNKIKFEFCKSSIISLQLNLVRNITMGKTNLIIKIEPIVINSTHINCIYIESQLHAVGLQPILQLLTYRSTRNT